ncbi:MAG: T9SS type A sorting domain-containing protein [Flavobacteriales bacterium]|nr:T9SS type A sorting domain-containing protein [Flavobacteriales bacterium]
MKRLSLLVTLLGSTIYVTSAQTATYNSDVSCILYEHCTTCHHDGGVAPFSLMDYSSTSANAFGLQSAVNSGIMPPWPPNSDYNQLAHERVLSQEEIDILNDWVNNGAPEGPGIAPQAPVYSNAEMITNPDLVLTMPLFTINSQNNDDYRCFVIPTGLTQDVYITEIEIVPGNNEAVHHVLLFQDATATPANLDAQDPEPGYTSFGGTGSSASEAIGGWVPGQSSKIYPNGMGVKVPVGADVIMQVHYPMSANGQQDQTKVNIKYSTTPVRELVISSPLHHYGLNEGTLALPPDQLSTFTTQYALPMYDITVLDVSPHMHLLGKSIKAWATTPGGQIIPFIDIPEWDFNWQGFYDFKNPIKLPAGSILHSTATYDNTASNPANPNSPPQWVYVGESTTEEMMLVFFSFTLYFPGDENIVIDGSTGHDSHACQSLVSTTELAPSDIQIFPNPVSDRIYFNLSGSTIRNISLTNALSQTVISLNPNKRSIDVSNLSEGVYFLRIDDENGTLNKKVIINH